MKLKRKRNRVLQFPASQRLNQTSMSKAHLIDLIIESFVRHSFISDKDDLEEFWVALEEDPILIKWKVKGGVENSKELCKGDAV
jgi:hypothetical protein